MNLNNNQRYSTSHLLSKIVDKVLDVKLVNDIGEFSTGAYKIIDKEGNPQEVLIVYKGSISEIENLRLNSACFSGDLFGCTRCDCNEQMQKALEYIVQHENGMIIYLLHHDGRGQGIVNKLRSYKTMDIHNTSTAKAFEMLNLEIDIRDFEMATIILLDNGIKRVNLLTSNPNKLSGLENYGIKIKKRIPLISEKPELQKYLNTKKEELNYIL